MKVLISGYYGFGNLGDEALLSGIISGLQTEHQLTVLSNQPAQTRNLHGVAAVHRYRWIMPALLTTDVFISGGGGLLQDKTSARSLQYYLMLINLAKRLGKRCIVFGQSIGPLSSEGKTAVARALQGIPVAVRDEASQTLLADLGIEGKLVADGALLLKARPQQRSKTVLFIPRHGYPDVTDGLIRVAASLVEQGVSVAATMLQADEDKSELERLRKAVPTLDTLTLASPDELLETISKMGYVISARLHGLILAAVAGINFSGIIYDPKVEAFLKEVGAPALTLPLNDRALLRLALDQPDVPPEKVEALKARAQEGIKWLNELMKK